MCGPREVQIPVCACERVCVCVCEFSSRQLKRMKVLPAAVKLSLVAEICVATVFFDVKHDSRQQLIFLRPPDLFTSDCLDLTCFSNQIKALIFPSHQEH